MNYSPRERVAYIEGVKQGRIESEVSQAAEIERLKAELELRTKERDQAIAWGDILHGDEEKTPELYAHLAGRGE